jgi:AAHS family 4-hydroxybenzoate transporter-like MFS transporter
MKTLNVERAIDEGPFTSYQKFVIAATASLIVLDGMDGQVLANALPSLTREWNLPRAAFATASAAAPFGMMLGGVLGGMLSDRIGRRPALLGSVITFAIPTLATAFVTTMPLLILARFIAGIGLGGAMPNATALVAEFAPLRHRPLAITATIVCIPLGGFLGGIIAGQIVPIYGWRSLFVIGGVVPLALALSLVKVLPESPAFLAARHQPRSRGSIAALLAPDLRRDTLSLVLSFMSCLLAIWMGFIWIPAMLTGADVGFAQADASYALSLFNFGGVAGAIAGAIVIQRFGSRRALLVMTALTIASSLVMAGMPPSTQAFVRTMVLFTVTGALMNAVQATMYALAAHVFPTAIRGTGVGMTVAVGRAGNVLASYVGSWALLAGGPPFFFMTWAAALTIVFVALAMIQRHIPRTIER